MDKEFSLDELYLIIEDLVMKKRLVFNYHDNEKLNLEIVKIAKDRKNNVVKVVFKDNFTETLIKLRDDLKDNKIG